MKEVNRTWRWGMRVAVVGCYLLIGEIKDGYTQNILWEQFYGGTNYDAGQKLLMMEDGSIVIAGEVRSQDGLGLRNHSANSDIFIRHMAAQGVVYWEAVLGGSGMEMLADIVPSPDGGVVVLGTTDSEDGDPGTGQGFMDIWAVKLNNRGEVIWQRRMGGSGNDRGYSIASNSEGGYIVGGSSGSRNGDMRSNRYSGIDTWLARLDENGKLLWERHLGGNKNEWPTVIKEVRPGWFLVMNGSNSSDGFVERSLGEKDAWIFLMDSWGNIEWQTTLGASKNDEIHDCLVAANGDLLLAGTTLSSNGMIPTQRGRGDFWLVRLSSKGEFKWSQTYGGTWAEGISSICPSVTGEGYLLSGLTKSRDGDVDTLRGFYDALLIHVDEMGNKIWSGTLGHAAKDALFSVVPTSNGTYVGVGFSEINPEPAEDEIIPHIGGFDVWVVNFSEPDEPLKDPYRTPISYTGKIVNKLTGEPMAAKVIFRDGFNEDSLMAITSDSTTGAFATQLPTKGLLSVEIFKPGFMYYGENLLMDTLLSKPRTYRHIEISPIKTGESSVLGNIFFDPGRWEILSNSMPELRRMIRFLEINPTIVIELSGHTDNTGRRQDKQELSQNRADAVRKFLIDKGVDPRRLLARGFGMTKPIASNNSPQGRRKNRRVEFKVLRMR